MNPRFRKPFRIAIRALAIFVTVLALSCAALWLFRANALTLLAKRTLEDFGFDRPQLTVSEAHLDSLTVEEIQLEHPQAKLALKKLELTFSLAELFQHQRIRSVKLTRATAELPMPASSSGDADEPFELNNIADLLQQLDLTAYLPLPFESIQILDSSISAVDQKGTLTARIEAEARATSPDTLALKAKISRANQSLDLAAQLSTPDRSSIQATLHLDSPLAAIEELIPDWKNELPDLKSLSTGPLDLTLTLPPSSGEPPQLEVSFKLQTLALEYEEFVARIPQVSGTSSVSSLSQIPIEISLVPELLTRDTMALAPNTPIELGLILENNTVLKILTRFPIDWNYDSSFAMGKSNLDLSYDLSQSEQAINGLVISESLSLDGTEISPVTLSLSGSTNRLGFVSSQLSLPDYPQASIDQGQGSILIPESDTEPIEFRFQSVARLPQPSPAHILPAFNLALSTEVFDASTQTKITLASQPAATLAKLPDLADLQGRLSLQLSLNQDSVTERFSGEVLLDASDISIQSEFLAGNGIGLQSKLSFQDLDLDNIDTENPLAESSINYLLNHTSTTIDWQANQLTASSIDAQWSGGSLSLKSSDSQILADASFGAGILAYDALRLEQLYLENQYRGNLANLSGSSTLTALLEGSPIELSSSQQIEDLLSSVSVSGGYTLNPIVFTHSDLPARFAPELAGVSFSGNLQASGAFQAKQNAADASISASISQGSIAYPASQLTANGLEADLHLDSLLNLNSGESYSHVSIASIDAGDAKATDAKAQFRIIEGKTIGIDSAAITFFGGRATIEDTEIPIDGSDFKGEFALEKISLDEIARYMEAFDGSMEGRVSGFLPFRMRQGAFELLRGALTLPDGTPATLRYETKGLLTQEDENLPKTKPTFSDRLLKFLHINPEKAAEQALGNITITDFEADLFPEDAPDTPIRIRMSGIAHSDLGDIPVVIATQVHGSLSELYNFLIRLNSL